MVVAGRQFIRDIPDVLGQFPNLRKFESGNKISPFLKGILDIPNDHGEVEGSFLIELHNSPEYPYRFPTLYEVGGEIENSADWHKYPDGSCCITVEPEEIIQCNGGLNLLGFLNNHAIPYFLNQIHRKRFGYYLNGEYSHGPVAVSEYYSELLGGGLKEDWAKWALMAFENFRVPRFSDSCPCDSGKRFKNCHYECVLALKKLGKSNYLKSIRILK